MCGRYVLNENLAHLVSHALEEPEVREVARYNIAPTQAVPIVRLSESGETWRIDAFHWGLVPFWSKERQMRQNLFNARAETVAEKPAFRAAFKRRRCLVPATGYYEWAGPKGDRRTYYIERKDGKPLILAGLWEKWTGADQLEPLFTFTILTCASNAEMEEFHHRMPVVLDEADQEIWMDPLMVDTPALQNLLVPMANGSLEIKRVGTWVNRATNEGERCIEPFQSDGQGELF